MRHQICSFESYTNKFFRSRFERRQPPLRRSRVHAAPVGVRRRPGRHRAHHALRQEGPSHHELRHAVRSVANQGAGGMRAIRELER